MPDDLAFSGFDDDDRQGAHRHTTHPQRWQRGQTRVTVIAYCCPQCGSLDVRVRDNGRTPNLVRWECDACRHAWKEFGAEVPKRVVVPT